jgi:hypothetical protein
MMAVLDAILRHLLGVPDGLDYHRRYASSHEGRRGDDEAQYDDEGRSGQEEEPRADSRLLNCALETPKIMIEKAAPIGRRRGPFHGRRK